MKILADEKEIEEIASVVKAFFTIGGFYKQLDFCSYDQMLLGYQAGRTIYNENGKYIC